MPGNARRWDGAVGRDRHAGQPGKLAGGRGAGKQGGDPSICCPPNGFPRIMVGGFQDEWAATSKITWLIHGGQSETRRVDKPGPDRLRDDITVLERLDLARLWHAIAHRRRVMQPHTRTVMWPHAENDNTMQTAHDAPRLVRPGEFGCTGPASGMTVSR